METTPWETTATTAPGRGSAKAVVVAEVLVHWWRPEGRHCSLDRPVVAVVVIIIAEWPRRWRLYQAYTDTSDTCHHPLVIPMP